MEIKWGLIPDMSITRTLPRLVGIDVAKELTYTGRVFSGRRPTRSGWSPHLADDPLAAALELAGRDRRPLARRGPPRQAAVRRVVDRRRPRRRCALEAELQLELIGSPNQLAAVTAGLTKQPAEFTDPALTIRLDGRGEDCAGVGRRAARRQQPPSATVTVTPASR